MTDQMNSAVKMAGFFAAHAIWSVCEGETLIPLLGMETPDGQRKMLRLANERIEDGVQQGQVWLKENPDRALRAVLVFDGFITLATGKIDALLVSIRDYSLQPRCLVMAVPYRSANIPGGFAVYRPKFLSFEGPEPNWQEIADSFFKGVDSHEKAAPIWNQYLDQSI